MAEDNVVLGLIQNFQNSIDSIATELRKTSDGLIRLDERVGGLSINIDKIATAQTNILRDSENKFVSKEAFSMLKETVDEKAKTTKGISISLFLSFMGLVMYSIWSLIAK